MIFRTLNRPFKKVFWSSFLRRFILASEIDPSDGLCTSREWFVVSYLLFDETDYGSDICNSLASLPLTSRAFRESRAMS